MPMVLSFCGRRILRLALYSVGPFCLSAVFVCAQPTQTTPVTSANSTGVPGIPWSPPTIQGGDGGGAYQFVVSGKTNYPGHDNVGTGQEGTLLINGTVSATWTPEEADTYTFWVRKAGDGTYDDSPSTQYTLTVAKLDQTPQVYSQDATAFAGLPWTPNYNGGVSPGGGSWQFSVLGQTNWSASAWTPPVGTFYFYVRKTGDIAYNESRSHNPAATVPIGGLTGYYTLVVSKRSQPTLIPFPATIPVENSWTPFFYSTMGGAGDGLYQFKVDGQTDWVSSWTPTAGGTYQYRIRNAGDANYLPAESAGTATVTVNAPPTIVVQPQNRAVPQGTSTTFSVQATGHPAVSYQWYWNDTAFTDATGDGWTGWNTSTLQTSALQPNDLGSIKVVVSNGLFANVISNTVTLSFSQYQYAVGDIFFIRGITYTNGTIAEVSEGLHITAGDDPATTLPEPVNVQSGARITYTAPTNKSIRLVSGFRAHSGSFFHARLGASGGATYALTVNNGSGGGGGRAVGSSWPITAMTTPAGRTFVRWDLKSGVGALQNGSSPNATFVMGIGNATVEAFFDYVNGAGDEDGDTIPNAVEGILQTQTGSTTVDSNNTANLKVHKPQ